MTEKMSNNTPLEALDLLRRSVDLRIDRTGKWWQGDKPFLHRGIIDVFNRGLGLHGESGEATVHVGDKWCYVKCDYTPFLVRRIIFGSDGGLQVLLNNESEWTIPQDGLCQIGDTLFVKLENGWMARFSRGAQNQIADTLIETNSGFSIQTRLGLWPIQGESRN